MNNNNYSPFMFGQNCYPSGMNNPQQTCNPPNAMNNAYAGQSSRRDAYNVRDCMYWPASLSTEPRQPNPRFNGPVNQASCGIPATSYPAYSQGDQYCNQGENISPVASPANFNNNNYVFHMGDYSTGEPQQQVEAPQQQAPAKAFIQNGKGQIPFNVSPQPGVVPAVQPMEYKVKVPQMGSTAPIEFEVASGQ